MARRREQTVEHNGGELVLPPSRYSRLHSLQMAGPFGDLPRTRALAARLAERRHQRHVHRPRAAEPRTRRRIGAGGQGAGSHREHPQTSPKQ